MLKNHDLESLKKQLETSLQATEKTIEHLDKGMDFGDDIDHFDEEADEAEEAANRVGMKEKLQLRVKNIEEAIAKIKGGSYGKCEKCGGEIELDVLHASPESKFCKNCKKKI